MELVGETIGEVQDRLSAHGLYGRTEVVEARDWRTDFEDLGPLQKLVRIQLLLDLLRSRRIGMDG